MKEKNSELVEIIEKKVRYYKKLINKTLIYVQKYKSYNIISTNDINVCYNSINEINTLLLTINTSNTDAAFEKLQLINDSFSNIFKNYGTECIDDILIICLGNNYLTNIDNKKYELIQEFFHPTSYKNLKWKGKENEDDGENNKKLILQKNKIIEDFMIVDNSDTLDCFDLARTSSNFNIKTMGIKICFQSKQKKRTLIVSGIVENVFLFSLTNEYTTLSLNELKILEKTIENKYLEDFKRYINSLTLKELLVYETSELLHKFNGYIHSIELIKKKEVSQIVKEFVSADLYEQRKQLIYMLIKNNDLEIQYLAYLLYDLLSNEQNNVTDTLEQTTLYDSLPWNVKIYFKDAMKYTLNYTNVLSSTEKNIPFEQQICLLKANESIKEKAMLKLKEIKSKSEDSGFKARQYLEGLLKIPFGSYKNEPILNILKRTADEIKQVLVEVNHCDKNMDSEKLCFQEICNYSKAIKDTVLIKEKQTFFTSVQNEFLKGKQEQLIINICLINNLIKKKKLEIPKITYSGKKKGVLKDNIKHFINNYENNEDIFIELSKLKKTFKNKNYLIVNEKINLINNNLFQIKNSLSDVEKTLDSAVYGHKNAKKQIERIIGQWISGKKSGYCFGFEGPPGLGKTSLAKRGISQCLKDDEGNSRPFSLIAIGGSSNGSTLDGHSYTYVGSTWGKIVDILMTTKCMNPIIFIDELDKISKTEHGKEITGVLTHLVDTTQNDSFQDKYFSGIPLDLSNVLFIFSYNDPSLVDRILLDRIHRVKFDPLTIYEKITISKKFIIPELTKEINLFDKVLFTDDIILFIIENYTFESGVRKLKELFFEIINEINLICLKTSNFEIPFTVTKKDIEEKFFKTRQKITHIEVPKNDSIGIVNGLWANSYGKGGIIPIESKIYPTKTNFELKLTGQQGDVMKESMIVARTLAWNYLKNNDIDVEKITNGIHVHCPEGAVPKDGPSAGTAITLSLLSLLLNKKVRRDVGITGEINLQGNITAIGGLELKVIGGIKGGVKTFVFPEENKNDLIKIRERYDESILDGITFKTVKHLDEAMKIVFVS
jgi:ATP-dependent Lon protease